MEVDKVVTVRFFLAWCLLATTAIALAGCRGAGASPEAGNANVTRRCHGAECLIAYRQPEVELMAVLDPEYALGGMLDNIKPGTVANGVQRRNFAGCGRPKPRYTPCPPHPNPKPRNDPFLRGR